MKKILLVLSVFISSLSFSQIIAAGDSLTLGDSKLYFRADTSAPEYENVIGGNITWDYSGLAMEYGVQPETNSVIDITASPFAADFPNAQYHENFPTGIQSFFTNNGNDLEIEGFVFENAGVDYRVVYDDDNLSYMSRPVSLGDMITDNIEGTAFAPFGMSTATADVTGTAIIEADGEGTLLIGENSYPNTIRIKTVENSNGTAMFGGNPVGAIAVERISYSYYSTSTADHFPLFMIGKVAITIPGGAVVKQKIVWSKDDTEGYLSVENDIEYDLSLTVFPNPAENSLNIQTSKGTEVIKIYNTIGKLVNIINNPKSTEVLDISNLSSGVYFVAATGSEETKTEKLVIK